MFIGPGAVVAPSILSQSAQALGPGSSIVDHLGFDSACAPTVAQMSTLWANSPWWWVGVYTGGVNVSCKKNTNLTAAWLNSAKSQGWDFAFFWVGEQAFCIPGSFYLMSTNTSTANTQGQNNAGLAFNRLTAAGGLGVTGSAAGTPITYDLEGYQQPAPGSACQLSVNAFMSGWTSYLHGGIAQKAGVYGSTCGSNLDILASVTPTVDYIHGASWDGNKSTSVMPCVSSSHWVTNQRLKQYQVNQSASQYGVNINVDYNCSHGPVAPSGSSGGVC
jgi:hypothetical protein